MGAISRSWAICVAATLMIAPVRAHHSFAAEFNSKDPVTLTGAVAKVEWINPHMWIHVDVKRPDGQVERWRVEGGGPNALARRGLTRDALPAGASIVIEGYRAWDGSNVANGNKLIFPDGRKLFMSSLDQGAPSVPAEK